MNYAAPENNALSPSIQIEPKILYFGMPVILVTTLNEDGTTNISPLSSSWALGHNLVLGMGFGGKCIENVQRTPQLVINVPDASLWRQVEKLAPLTGKHPVPDYKAQSGFRYEPDKFAAAGLTPVPSATISPARIAECPLQIECEVRNVTIPEYAPFFAIVETQAISIHAHPGIMAGGNHVDPSKWNPLIYNFRHYFGLSSALGHTYRAEV
ncbi:flavin reductase family protein [Paenibacillus profundus]|uniref:Flavin reductase family protein n=1 Tax=Paenibacillus profundus TaxID=1173085 RepID=A0ABS8YA12_9BACL|nr:MULTISPECIES: flavin reductase family protein [Paenibacillus]MCE5168725.1 flavin reductase family protein [Paenibacillus profundus]